MGIRGHLKTPTIRQVKPQWRMADFIRFKSLPAVQEEIQGPSVGQVDHFIFQCPAADI